MNPKHWKKLVTIMLLQKQSLTGTTDTTLSLKTLPLHIMLYLQSAKHCRW